MPVDPSDAEDEYFARQEIDRLKLLRRQTLQETAEHDRDRLKQQHWMRCPKCGMELAEVAYRGVSVDTCFSCGGMFLDQGEIEKVLDWAEPSSLQKMISGLFRLKDS